MTNINEFECCFASHSCFDRLVYAYDYGFATKIHISDELVSVEQKEPINTPVNLGRLHPTSLAAGAVGKATPEASKKINPEMVFRRILYLLATRGFQHEPPRKDFSMDHTQNVEIFMAKCALSSLDEILSKEMDLAFLQRLLDDILDVPGNASSPSYSEHRSVYSGRLSFSLQLQIH